MTNCLKRLALLFLIIFSFNAKGQISFTKVDTLEYYGSSRAFQSQNQQFIDFTNDDILDLVFVREREIVLKEGLGNGTFKIDSTLFHTADESILTISNLYDVNIDGFFDLAVLTTTSLRTLIGTENGFLVDQTSFFESNQYGKIIWKDFNNDGNLDLMLGNGSGIHINYNWDTNLDDFETILNNTTNFDIADFNKDGLDDFICFNGSFMQVHINNSSSFEQIFEVETFSSFFQVSDTNLDGYPDIVIIRNNQIEQFLNDYKNNTFQLNPVNNTIGLNISYLGLADIDNNNTPDIFFSHNAGTISYMPNQEGEFTSITNLHGYDASISFRAPTAKDLNNDGQLDIINIGENNFDTFILNNVPLTDTSYWDEFSPNSQSLIYDDFDNDGINDIGILGKHGNFYLKWGLENGFEKEVILKINNNATQALLYDYDNNGIKDIIYTQEARDGGNNLINIIYGLANREYSVSTKLKFMPRPSKPLFIDLDNNGTSEMLVFSEYGKEIVWFDKTNDSLDEYITTSNKVTLTQGDGLKNISINHLNTDNFLDIVTLNISTENVSVLANNGDGSFSETTIELERQVFGMNVFDYNNDNINDILITTINSHNTAFELQVYIGDNELNFEYFKVHELPLKNNPGIIEFHDLDNDGDLEIIVSASEYSSTTIFENINNSFDMNSTFSLDQVDQSNCLFVDVDEDNKLDFFSISQHSGNLYIRKNNSITEPSIEDLITKIDSVSGTFIDISSSSEMSNGVFVVVKEGHSSEILNTPTDNSFYTVNRKFGEGDQLDGGYIVYSGQHDSFRIEGLKPFTNYVLFSFAQNQNFPENSLINYSDEYTHVNLTTTTSLYLLKEFETIVFNEDEKIEIQLNEFINNIGSNNYSFSSSNPEIKFQLENQILTLSATENYFGDAEISISVQNEFESKEFTFALQISSVNDSPAIPTLEDINKGTLETITLDIPAIFDVEDSNSELDIMITSENQDIVSNTAFSTSVFADKISIEFTPLNFGMSTLTLTVTDSEGLTSSQEFSLNLDVTLGINSPKDFKLYPNPSSNWLYIESNEESLSFEIHSVLGIKLLEGTTSSGINISSLEKGSYILLTKDQKIRFIKN